MRNQVECLVIWKRMNLSLVNKSRFQPNKIIRLIAAEYLWRSYFLANKEIQQ